MKKLIMMMMMKMISIGERAKRARHSQVCSIENRGYIIGRAKRAPHWGVQSRFCVIYIYIYVHVSVVCQITWNHVNQTRAFSKSVLGGKIGPVTPALFISAIC